MDNTQIAGVDYEKQYRIIIDGTSPLAQLHKEGASSFMQFPQGAGEEDRSGPSHPVLHCSGLNILHSSLLGFTLAESSDDPSPLMVWIPYTHILGIIEVDVPIEKAAIDGDEDGKVVAIGSASGKSASRQIH